MISVDLLTVVSDRTARSFSKSDTTQAAALDISKVKVLSANLKSYGISGQIFGLIFSFLSNRQLRVVLDGKSSQEYPVKAPFLVLQVSCYTFMTLLMMPSVMLLYMMMILLSILSVIRHLICSSS